MKTINTTLSLFLMAFIQASYAFSNLSKTISVPTKTMTRSENQHKLTTLHFQNKSNEEVSNNNNNNKKEGIFGGIKNAFNNLDGIAEDFFYKRMGKGEIFYGKRAYKPSGDVDGDYQGFGLSDKLKIDMTRDYKDAWLEEKNMRDEMRQIKEEKEARDRSR